MVNVQPARVYLARRIPRDKTFHFIILDYPVTNMKFPCVSIQTFKIVPQFLVIDPIDPLRYTFLGSIEWLPENGSMTFILL